MSPRLCIIVALGAAFLPVVASGTLQAGTLKALGDPLANAEAVAHRELQRIRADGQKISQLEASNSNLQQENAQLEGRMKALEQGGVAAHPVEQVAGPVTKRMVALKMEVTDLKNNEASVTQDNAALVSTVQHMLRNGDGHKQREQLSSYVRTLQEENAAEDKQNQELRGEVLAFKKALSEQQGASGHLKKKVRSAPKFQPAAAPLALSDAASEADPGAMAKIMDFTANFQADQNYAKDGVAAPMVPALDSYLGAGQASSFAQQQQTRPQLHSLDSFLGASWQKPLRAAPKIAKAVVAQDGFVLSKWLGF